MARTVSLAGSVAARLHERSGELADTMVERIREGTDAFEEPELRETLRASCFANLETGLASLAHGISFPADIPAGARDFALLCARLDVPLAELLRTYRLGHSMIWEDFFAEVEREADGEKMRRAALDAGSRFFFDTVDRLSGYVTDEYTAERDRLLRTREQRRTQLVRDVLDGAQPDPAGAVRELDYDLRLHHVACVLAGSEPEQALRALAAALETQHQLFVSLSSDTAWAWLGRVRPFDQLASPELPDGVGVSLGDPGTGIEGFRRSHREARDAHQVALRTGAPLTRYDEVALEALAGVDERRMRAFVERELRGLDGRDARSTRLRQTLRAYFAAGQNASAAAAMLGVHDHTVTYRLRTIEGLLGRPVTVRRAELETALRLLLVLEAQKPPSG